MMLKIVVAVLLVSVCYAEAEKVDCFNQTKIDEKVEKMKGWLKDCKAANEESDEKYSECMEEKWSQKLGGKLDIKKIMKIKLDMTIQKHSDVAVVILECKELADADSDIEYPLLTFQRCLYTKMNEICNLPDAKKIKEEVLETEE